MAEKYKVPDKTIAPRKGFGTKFMQRLLPTHFSIDRGYDEDFPSIFPGMYLLVQNITLRVITSKESSNEF